MTHLAKRPGCRACNVNRRRLLLGLALLLAVGPASGAADEKAVIIGRPTSLVVQPESIRLSGPRAAQQIIVTGRYRDGSERDLHHPQRRHHKEVLDGGFLRGSGMETEERIAVRYVFGGGMAIL